MKTKKELRARRRYRIRAKISGTGARLRLAIYRSNSAIYAQLIDDEKKITILSFSKKGKNKGVAQALGTEIASAAKEKRITSVVFDRGGFRYHGVIRELAEAARAGGLQC